MFELIASASSVSPWAVLAPAALDLAQQGAANTVCDFGESIGALSEGDPGQLAADIIMPGASATETGELLQDQLGTGLDATFDLLRGDAVTLELDPEFLPQAAEALVDDGASVVTSFVKGLGSYFG